MESKNLRSKKRVLEYVQDCGTAAMQVFCAKNQRRIQEYLEDAKEWMEAKAAAEFEKRQTGKCSLKPRMFHALRALTAGTLKRFEAFLWRTRPASVELA